MRKLLPFIAVGLSGVILLYVSWQPINSMLAQSLLLVAILAFAVCLFLLSKGHRAFRILLLAVAACLIALMLLPGRAADPQRLKARYLAALPRYVNSPYVWGGEQSSGIDCSGLPRKALRDALFQEGILTLNGRLIREGLRQWWFDASAASLAAGYRGYMVPVHEQGTIRHSAFPGAQPGDIAITNTGIHCLVYLHDKVWIQAEPGVGKVAIFDLAKNDSEWFDAPVSLYRWTDFE